MENHKFLFIDRDGVINVDLIGDYVKTWDEFKFEAGALDTLKTLSDRGYEIVIISNQAGVGDGIFTKEALETIQRRMLGVFEQKGIKIRSTHYCLHGKDHGCFCRKPETGLFQEAVGDAAFEPSETFFIGDKATDIEAGKRFGLRTIFVRTGHGRADEPKLKGDLEPDYRVDSIRDVPGILIP